MTAYLRAAYATPFGRQIGSDPISLMTSAANRVLEEANVTRSEVDGLICGYATTMPHLMLANLFAENFGLKPVYAHGLQMGGSTGAAMIHLARILVNSGTCRTVLVVAGENRLTGQSRDSSIQTLAQVGHLTREVPNGGIVPAYYALLASRYLHDTGATREDLAAFAVLMRRNAAKTPGAHFKDIVSSAQVMNSRLIASPLKLLDCCPISDGGAAVLVTALPGNEPAIALSGAGQAHLHQHVTEASDDAGHGAQLSMARAYADAGITASDIGFLGIYDSFTITLALLLEASGISALGRAGAEARDGRFDADGALPLNTHGGLLSYGHCGVAGAMAHVVETLMQLQGKADDRQIATSPTHALIHGDGGILSSHVSLVLERVS